MKEVKHMQSKSEGTKDMKQMQRSKGKGWDGKSRPVQISIVIVGKRSLVKKKMKS